MANVFNFPDDTREEEPQNGESESGDRHRQNIAEEDAFARKMNKLLDKPIGEGTKPTKGQGG